VRAENVVAGALLLLTSIVSFSACSSVAGEGAGEPSCTNAIKDGDEIGVDCGGTCTTLCTGAGCTKADECASGKCENSACGAKDGKPCGVGTTTPLCENGQPCELDKDCKSLTCVGATCALTPDSPPGPADGKKNNGETDIDCGGANAPKCADGKTCEADGDCTAGYCPADTKKCIAPSYDDTVKNGTETDVDCGGTVTTAGFKKCAEGKDCLADTDCSGACSYKKKCVDAPSCKPRLGGDTCGKSEAIGSADHESCCKSLLVPGFTDAARPGKKVYLDKYEITAGRVRAFVESVPNIKAWVTANQPPLWSASWSQFLPSSATTDTISVPRKPTSEVENPPWFRNVGSDFQFNQQLYIYVHGHNCGNEKLAYGFPTFFYPAAVMTANGGLPRANPTDGANIIQAKDALDVKSMNCITSAMLAAFCHWDGGQLATDEVLDFVTGSPASLGSAAGCGAAATGNRCAPVANINATSDSGTASPLNYYFPYYDNATVSSPATHEGVSRISAPGRAMTATALAGQQTDVVRINAGDEPWMDLHGNLHEQALDVAGATFGGFFALKYRGIGYSSARAGGNSVDTNIKWPEYRAGYSGGRCMRFK
jgi:hypothetical protein